MFAALRLWWSVCVRVWAVTAAVVAAFVGTVLFLDPVAGGLVWWQAAFVGGVTFGAWFGVLLATATMAILVSGSVSRWWMLPVGAAIGAVGSWVGSVLGVVLGLSIVLLPGLRPGVAVGGEVGEVPGR